MTRDPTNLAVRLYRPGMAVMYNNYERIIAHNILSGGELYLVFTDSTQRIHSNEVQVPVTCYTIYHDD